MPTTLTLNNGVAMPAVGLGVFQTPPDVTTGAVEEALRVGYRHVDTAAAYGNEREVGEGIRRSGVAHDEVFVETKVWISDYGHDATLHAFDTSAAKLGVDRLDLLILHQPLTSRFDLTLDAYRALEELLAGGRVRAIGVSNFMPEHLDRLLEETSVVPAVNPSAAVRSRTASPWRPTAGPSPRRETAVPTTPGDRAMNRRTLLQSSLAAGAGALLPGCGAPGPSSGAAPAPAQPSSAPRPTASGGSRVLLAYFSRAGENYSSGGRTFLEVGNTAVVADMISSAVPVDVVEAADPYTRLCPRSTIGEGLAVRGEEARDARPDVEAWLRRVGLLSA